MLNIAAGRSSVAAASLLAVVAAGCGGGGGGSDLSSPAASVKTYLHALAKNDGATACSALAPSLQQRALGIARSQGIKAKSCADLFTQAGQHLDPTKRKKTANATTSNVSTHGNSATVTVPSATQAPKLTKSGDKWLITGGIGF